MKRLSALGLIGALAAACSAHRADAPAAKSAAEPAAAAETAPASTPGQYAPPPPQAGAPAAPAPAVPAPHGRGPAARAEALRRSVEQLASAGSDCTLACRALGSMDRAAGEICELDGREAACLDAERRVRDSRDRVRRACGACPEGVTVDRDAPIPSAAR